MKNILIVGQGVAGSHLAMQLHKKGCKITVVDNKSEMQSSTLVSAGLYNPLVFRRILLSWKAKELIPLLEEDYPKIERLTNQKFFYPLESSKIIESDDELLLWNKKINEGDLSDFIDNKISEIEINNENISYNSVTIKHTGYVDTAQFLKAIREFIKTNHTYISEEFDFKKLIHTEKGVIYKDATYDKVIFCEGYYVEQNPYFSFVPLKPVNGDILTLQFENYNYPKIINKNFFLLPFHDGTYKLGSTYNWKNLTFKPNEVAKEELLNRLRVYIKETPEVIDHIAGVRPSSKDRRPIIGQHKEYKNFYIFNGLGAKGIMIAPYCAKNLTNHILYNEDILEEIDVKRFY